MEFCSLTDRLSHAHTNTHTETNCNENLTPPRFHGGITIICTLNDAIASICGDIVVVSYDTSPLISIWISCTLEI